MELPVNFNDSMEDDSSINIELRSEIISNLVKELRRISSDPLIKGSDLVIPDNCEKYGFAEGTHNLEVLLYFLADMLEE